MCSSVVLSIFTELCGYSHNHHCCIESFWRLNKITYMRRWTQCGTLRYFSTGDYRFCCCSWGLYHGRWKKWSQMGGKRRTGDPLPGYPYQMGVTDWRSQQLVGYFPAPITSQLKWLDRSHLGLVWVGLIHNYVSLGLAATRQHINKQTSSNILLRWAIVKLNFSPYGCSPMGGQTSLWTLLIC